MIFFLFMMNSEVRLRFLFLHICNREYFFSKLACIIHLYDCQKVEFSQSLTLPHTETEIITPVRELYSVDLALPIGIIRRHGALLS